MLQFPDFVFIAKIRALIFKRLSIRRESFLLGVLFESVKIIIMSRTVRTKIITTVLCLCVLSLFPFDSLAQQTIKQEIKMMESYLFKLSSAPYRLEAMANGRGFEFCNTSKKRLKHIQLGCVKSKNNELSILSEREIIKWDNDPKSEETEICSFWVGHHGFFPTDECKKGKLALIEVAFEDGVIWKLKQ